jgi:uncharacterized SAM-binding protein YcdF (DUF218 family)
VIRALLALLPAVGLALAAGFAWFVGQTEVAAPASALQADGIVVLTGGADRVAAGLHLLERQAAARLLISGVGAQASFHDLAHLAGVDPGLAPRVTLGRMADSTHGNAAETADWVAEQHIASLIVVTASYHMPRALAELRARVGSTRLIADPVTPPAMRSLRDWQAWRLLLREYAKFLAVMSGVRTWGW